MATAVRTGPGWNRILKLHVVSAMHGSNPSTWALSASYQHTLAGKWIRSRPQDNRGCRHATCWLSKNTRMFYLWLLEFRDVETTDVKTWLNQLSTQVRRVPERVQGEEIKDKSILTPKNEIHAFEWSSKINANSFCRKTVYWFQNILLYLNKMIF